MQFLNLLCSISLINPPKFCTLWSLVAASLQVNAPFSSRNNRRGRDKLQNSWRWRCSHLQFTQQKINLTPSGSILRDVEWNLSCFSFWKMALFPKRVLSAVSQKDVWNKLNRGNILISLVKWWHCWNQSHRGRRTQTTKRCVSKTSWGFCCWKIQKKNNEFFQNKNKKEVFYLPETRCKIGSVGFNCDPDGNQKHLETMNRVNQ